MMPDDLGDDEVQELLGERGIQIGIVCEFAQPRDLLGLPIGIGGRQIVLSLELTDLLGAPESLSQHVHEGRVDIVDTRANLLELRECVVGLCHSRGVYGAYDGADFGLTDRHGYDRALLPCNTPP